MFGTDDLDTNSIYPSDFDVIRLECMGVGDKIEAENGNWVVFKYEKDYLLFINVKKPKKEHNFKTIGELIVFLRKY